MSSQAGAADEPRSVAGTYGALLIGTLCSALLSGMLFIQCIAYAKTFSNDNLRTKLFVLAIWIQDLLHDACIWSALWIYLIKNFGDYAHEDMIPLTLSLSIAVTASLTLCVHLFFCWRIFRLSQNNFFITIPIVILAVARLVSACLTCGQMIHLKTLTRFKEEYSWVFTLGLALSTAVDILITGSLLVMLQSSKRNSFTLDSVIDSLILYTIENAAATTIATIAALTCWLAMHDNLIFMGLHFVILKLYANSALAVLNHRQTLRKHARHSHQDVYVDLDSLHFSPTMPVTTTFPSIHTRVIVSGTHSSGNDSAICESRAHPPRRPSALSVPRVSVTIPVRQMSNGPPSSTLDGEDEEQEQDIQKRAIDASEEPAKDAASIKSSPEARVESGDVAESKPRR